VRLIAVIVLLWLLIGVLAAFQRGYITNSSQSCAHLSTVAITVVAGPLNYVGVNPKVGCTVPQPSK
jgi:hypothetical protein